MFLEQTNITTIAKKIKKIKKENKHSKTQIHSIKEEKFKEKAPKSMKLGFYCPKTKTFFEVDNQAEYELVKKKIMQISNQKKESQDQRFWNHFAEVFNSISQEPICEPVLLEII